MRECLWSLAGETAGQFGGSPRMVVHPQGTGDAQGQRQPAAQCHHPVYGIKIIFWPDASVAHDAQEQLGRIHRSSGSSGAT